MTKLPFPLWALGLGAIGAVLLTVGVLALVGTPLLPVLADSAVGGSLVVVGALCLLVEGVVIVQSLRGRDPR